MPKVRQLAGAVKAPAVTKVIRPRARRFRIQPSLHRAGSKAEKTKERLTTHAELINIVTLSAQQRIREALKFNFPNLKTTLLAKGLKHLAAFNRAVSSGNHGEAVKILEKLLNNTDASQVSQALIALNAVDIAMRNQVSATVEQAEPDLRFPKTISKLERLAKAKKQSKKLAELLRQVSGSLVLTAHPTAGMPAGYLGAINQLNRLLLARNRGENISERELGEAATRCLKVASHSDTPISVNAETETLIASLDNVWEQAPELVYRLLQSIETLDPESKPLPPEQLFTMQSWVARDLDGNPNINRINHLDALRTLRINLLGKYKSALKELSDKHLLADFKSGPLLQLTFIVSSRFHARVEQLKDKKPTQLYQAVINEQLIKPVNESIRALEECSNINSDDERARITEELLSVRNTEDSRRLKAAINVNEIREVLLDIRDNIAPAGSEHNYTTELDKVLIRLNIFGDYGARGHLRQGAEHLADIAAAIDDRASKPKLPASAEQVACKPENQAKIQQTLDLLRTYRTGGYQRIILSMTKSAKDLQNALLIAEAMGAYCPAIKGVNNIIPRADIEIVPLTEQIPDLEKSYEHTIEALLDIRWREYLVARQGKFIKMRGPSDSGKQNGVMPAQWAIFKSKQEDGIVVGVFNALLKQALNGDTSELALWQQKAQETSHEAVIARTALKRFGDEIFNRTEEIAKTQNLFRQNHVNRIELVHFDGWGEPVERGHGLDFLGTLTRTAPDASSLSSERTVQGGNAQGFQLPERVKGVLDHYFTGLVTLAKRKLTNGPDIDNHNFNPGLRGILDKWSEATQKHLRTEVIGLEHGQQADNEDKLKQYFLHVLLSPIIYLDYYHIASRPVSRSGAAMKKRLQNVDFTQGAKTLLASNAINPELITKTLDDIRAIPYAAMFNLFGGNHMPYVGISSLTQISGAADYFKDLYHSETSSQESRFVRHLIDSIEISLGVADLETYSHAHKMMRAAIGDHNYSPANDPLIQLLKSEHQKATALIARIKGKKNNRSFEAQVHSTRKRDASITRLTLAASMTAMFKFLNSKAKNPLNLDLNLEDFKSLEEYKLFEAKLASIRTALTACCSNFGSRTLD